MEIDRLQRLVTANEHLDDLDQLDSQFDALGYLFLRDVVDLGDLDPVTKAFRAELRDQGLLRADGLWTGQSIELVDEEALHGAIPYDDFWRSSSMKALYDLLFREPVHVFKQTQLRFMPPESSTYLTPPHQDGAYIGPTDHFVTVWVPLVNCGDDLGGVTVAVGSHHRGLREHVATELEMVNSDGLKYSGVPPETITEQWAAADYRRGDALVFKPYMVHCSVPNRSTDQVRLSMDTRVQPTSEPRGYAATHTAVEIKAETRQKMDWFPDVKV